MKARFGYTKHSQCLRSDNRRGICKREGLSVTEAQDGRTCCDILVASVHIVAIGLPTVDASRLRLARSELKLLKVDRVRY